MLVSPNDGYFRKIFEIESIITHEGYGSATGFKDDIALIKLKTEVNSGQMIIRTET